MRAERFTDFLYRYRYPIFGLWLVHVFLLHYFVLGYMSWDGFGYRVGPTIELLQHGSLGKEKYNDWIQRGYLPFVELSHIPFLVVFGMRGLIIGFPLVVFPLCVAAMFLLLRELTGDRRAGLFGAFAYAAIPMMNQQPFSGYIDFAVAGILAFWIYAVLRLRADERRRRTYVRLAIATLLLTLARQQGLYIVIVLFPILAYAMFGTRERFRIRFTSWRAVGLGALVIGLAAIPAIGVQIYKTITYGSPIAPLELKLLGIKLCDGVPMKSVLHDAGVPGDDLGSMAKAFFEGFVWYLDWPLSAFYGSRFMATGLVFLLAMILVPMFLRRSTRAERWLVVGLVAVSILARDYAVPRWSYGVMLSIIVIVGRSMAELVTSLRWRPLFWFGTALLTLHLLRPELDLFQYREKKVISPRMNVGKSKHFIPGDYVVLPHPDRHSRYVIIEATAFYVALFGLRLTNEIIGTIPGAEIDAGCRRLASFVSADPKVLFVDDQHFAKDCNRRCVVEWPGYCGGWEIVPAP